MCVCIHRYINIHEHANYVQCSTFTLLTIGCDIHLTCWSDLATGRALGQLQQPQSFLLED